MEERSDFAKASSDRKVEILYQFFYPEHERELNRIHYVDEMVSTLWAIQALCWEESHNTNEENLSQLHSDILSLISQIPLDEM